MQLLPIIFIIFIIHLFIYFKEMLKKRTGQGCHSGEVVITADAEWNRFFFVSKSVLFLS